MKLFTVLKIAIIFAVVSSGYAVAPPLPPPLDQRIAKSTIVIVGTITNVETVAVQDAQWTRWQPMVPRAVTVSSNIIGAITIRINEILYSKEPVTTDAVLFLFGDWGFNTADLDKYIGTKQIFILSKTTDAYVSAIARTHFFDRLDKRDEIVKAIKDFQAKEEKAPNNGLHSTSH